MPIFNLKLHTLQIHKIKTQKDRSVKPWSDKGKDVWPSWVLERGVCCRASQAWSQGDPWRTETHGFAKGRAYQTPWLEHWAGHGGLVALRLSSSESSCSRTCSASLAPALLPPFVCVWIHSFISIKKGKKGLSGWHCLCIPCVVVKMTERRKRGNRGLDWNVLRVWGGWFYVIYFSLCLLMHRCVSTRCLGKA